MSNYMINFGLDCLWSMGRFFKLLSSHILNINTVLNSFHYIYFIEHKKNDTKVYRLLHA